MIWDSPEAKPDVAKYWKGVKNPKSRFQECACEVFTCLGNCQADFQGRSNAFFGAFFEAYNHHQDILLAPDDMWLLVCLHFSKYVNDNAEQLRDKFVTHEGQKNLTVETRQEISESEWQEFFTKILPE